MTDAVDIAGTMGDGFTSMVGDVMGVVVIVLPIALGIVGLFFAVKAGLKFFKSISNKA